MNSENAYMFSRRGTSGHRPVNFEPNPHYGKRANKQSTAISQIPIASPNKYYTEGRMGGQPQLKKLTNSVIDSDDPTVPSYAYPYFTPDEAPIDEEEVEAKKNEVALLHVDTIGNADAERAYPLVYRDEPFLQLPQTNLIVNPVPHYLTLDSRDRDRTTWRNTNQYKIPLVAPDNKPSVMSPNVRYKNIYSVSLLSAVIPNLGGVLSEPYLLLQIDEIDDVYDAANPACARAFTKLYFKEVCPGSSYLRLDKGVGDPLTKIYWPAPRASLESITISFRHYDGTLFDFGPDALPPADPLPDRQTSITLELRTFVVDSGKAIGHRNI
jgi:hypothetical protein